MGFVALLGTHAGKLSYHPESAVVGVGNAQGASPGADYKAIATWDDGWRAVAYQPVIGPAASEKAA